jgi:hypothetical protein
MILDDDDPAEDKLLWEEALKSTKRAKSGVDLDLEFTADRLLADARKGTTKHSEMTDYFSPSQIARRLTKEVYPASGIPDPHLYSGIYKRVHAQDRTQGPRNQRVSDEQVFPVTIRKIEDEND